MKNTFKTKTLSFAASVALAGGLAWSTNSHACSADTPVIGSICIMATPTSYGSFNRMFTQAAGQTIAITENQALFSLLGFTYGGDGRTTFALPDLRGRVIVGADARTPVYYTGKTGGQAAVTLSLYQLPVHTHTFSSAVVDFSQVTANTTLGTMTASLTGNLSLKASSVTGNQGAPSGNYLGTTVLNTNKIYADSASTPLVSLNSASIDSSTLSVGLNGKPSTTLSGMATVGGATNEAGASQSVSTMPPYLALTYYIATNGIYPSRD